MVRLILSLSLLAASASSLVAQTEGPPSRREREARKPIDAKEVLAIVEVECVLAEWKAPAEGGAKAGPVDLSGPTAEVSERVARLEKQGALSVVQRIRLTALDGHAAYIQTGERRPRVTGATSMAERGGFGGRVSTSVSYNNVGTLISVTPHVHAEGGITLELQVEKSGSRIRTDSPVLVESPGGEKVRADSVETLTLQTVVRVPNGQTAIAGGASDPEEQYLVLVTATASK